VAQFPDGDCPAEEVEWLNDGVFHHRRLQRGSVQEGHLQATLQEMGAAEVIGVGVGDEHRLQCDLQLIGGPQRSPGGVFIQPCVNQQSLPVLHDQPHVGAALQMEDAGGQFHLLQVHSSLHQICRNLAKV